MHSPKQPLKVVIVNRNYPPRSGITGESACHLAKYLESTKNAKVTVVSSRSNYAGGSTKTQPVGDVRLIHSWYDGKNKLFRLIGSFLESYQLIKTARSTKPDRIIVMTDPPFLQFWASLLLRKKCPWTLWAMDLYPDAFVSSKLVKPRNLIYRFLRYLTYKNAPTSMIALGPLQAEYLKDAYRDPIESVAIVPCGVHKTQYQQLAAPAWKIENTDKIMLGYCGNLGEAHSVEFLKQIINHLDPQRFHLVLSVYGVKAQEILNHADTKKEGISITARVEREQMPLIDIHLVSLMEEWSHVCVPSKAVSAICSGSPILLYGTRDCDNWKMLGFGGWLIRQSSDPNDVSTAVRDFLHSVDEALIEYKKRDAARVATGLQDMMKLGYSQFANQIGIETNPIEVDSTLEPAAGSTVLPPVVTLPLSAESESSSR